MKTQTSVFVLLGSVVATGCGGASTPQDSNMGLEAEKLAAKAAAAPAACGTDTLASNASGAAVNLASNNWNGSAWELDICATTDGVHWSGPTTVGEGTHPSAAIGPNGRVALLWASEIASTGAQSVQGSILSPGGSWIGPTVLNDTPGDPNIVMDSSGNALAMWATSGSDDNSAVQTSTLAANSTGWTMPVTLAPAGGLARLVGNAAGDVLITFRARTTNDIQAVSGTILGGLGAPVTLGITNGYVRANVEPVSAINSAGEAVVGWLSTYNGTEYATRSASGTWSPATQLAYPKTTIGVAVNGAGDFVVTWTNSAGVVETLTTPG